ncbi:hypothetical protein [Changpingibacter yushuensis]|nr:hypothetical protein [Changpingibacter yushuensis]
MSLDDKLQGQALGLIAQPPAQDADGGVDQFDACSGGTVVR